MIKLSSNYANDMRNINLLSYNVLTTRIATAIMFYYVASKYYITIEKWDIIDSIFFLTETMSTVGYGDYHPTKNQSRVVTIFLIIAGLSVLFMLVKNISRSIRCQLGKRMQTRIKSIVYSHNNSNLQYYYLLIYPLMMVLTLVTINTIIIWNLESDWSFIQAVYFTVTTMSTVGYGDLLIKSYYAKVYLIFFIPLSAVSMIYIATYIRFIRAKQQYYCKQRYLLNTVKLYTVDGDKKNKFDFLVEGLVKTRKCNYSQDVEPWLQRYYDEFTHSRRAGCSSSSTSSGSSNINISNWNTTTNHYISYNIASNTTTPVYQEGMHQSHSKEESERLVVIHPIRERKKPLLVSTRNSHANMEGTILPVYAGSKYNTTSSTSVKETNDTNYKVL